MSTKCDDEVMLLDDYDLRYGTWDRRPWPSRLFWYAVMIVLVAVVLALTFVAWCRDKLFTAREAPHVH